MVQIVMILEGATGSWQLSVALPSQNSFKLLCFGGKGLKWEEEGYQES